MIQSHNGPKSYQTRYCSFIPAQLAPNISVLALAQEPGWYLDLLSFRESQASISSHTKAGLASRVVKVAINRFEVVLFISVRKVRSLAHIGRWCGI